MRTTQTTYGGSDMVTETTDQTTEPKQKKRKPTGTATYTIGDLATMLGVSERHVHRLKDTNGVPGLLKLGGRIVFSKVVIDKWLAGAK